MVHIRKARAGNDSYGNEWPEDDAVIDVPVEQAAVLMAIPDGGFSEAPAPKKQEKQEEPMEPNGQGKEGGDGDPPTEPAEVPKPDSTDGDPPPDDRKATEIDEAPKTARRGRPPKAKTVEE
jgi:hypothetical protein